MATGLILAIVFFLDNLAAEKIARVPTPSEISPRIDQAIARARSEYPTHDIRDVRFPNADLSNIFFLAVERNPRAVHQVGVKLASLDIASKFDTEDDTSIWVAVYPLHTGESFGTIGRILVLMSAMSIWLLAVSGPIMWFQSPGRKSSRNPNKL
jgi:uncharacterized iron-regulated membrane protein